MTQTTPTGYRETKEPPSICLIDNDILFSTALLGIISEEFPQFSTMRSLQQNPAKHKIHNNQTTIILDADSVDDVEVKIENLSRKARILVSTTRLTEYLIYCLMKNAEAGLIVTKNATREVWRAAIYATLNGGRFYCSQSAALLTRMRASSLSWHKLLSPREVQLIRVLINGNSDNSASNLLKIAPATIKNYRHRLFSKLRLASTSELIVWGTSKGFSVFR